MKKILFAVSSLLLLLSGCSLGENPDTENFDIQYQEPSADEAQEEFFQKNQSTYETIRSSNEIKK